jgi:hypothetical protein
MLRNVAILSIVLLSVYSYGMELSVSATTSGGTVSSYGISIDCSLGCFGELVSGSSSTVKSGFAGELYDISSVVIDGPTYVSEGGVATLNASYLMDDSTKGVLDVVPQWQTNGFPIANLIAMNSEANVTASTVYQDEVANIYISAGIYSGSFALIVKNINNDDFGNYANDGISDAWEVKYFGVDGSLPINSFQRVQQAYYFGLDPTNPNDVFLLWFNQRKNNLVTVEFGPTFQNRTYHLESTTNLISGTWSEVGSPFVYPQDSSCSLMMNVTNKVEFYRVRVDYDGN